MAGMPQSMGNVSRLIRRLGLDAEPDSALISAFIVQTMCECGAERDDPSERE
jgi:hypothetical protein